jgi:hypothetical protein
MNVTVEAPAQGCSDRYRLRECLARGFGRYSFGVEDDLSIEFALGARKCQCVGPARFAWNWSNRTTASSRHCAAIETLVASGFR